MYIYILDSRCQFDESPCNLTPPNSMLYLNPSISIRQDLPVKLETHNRVRHKLGNIHFGNRVILVEVDHCEEVTRHPRAVSMLHRVHVLDTSLFTPYLFTFLVFLQLQLQTSHLRKRLSFNDQSEVNKTQKEGCDAHDHPRRN